MTLHALEQRCPTELSALTGMFSVYTAQDSSFGPRVAVAQSGCGWCDRGTDFSFYLFLMTFNLNGHTWLVATKLNNEHSCRSL